MQEYKAGNPIGLGRKILRPYENLPFRYEPAFHKIGWYPILWKAGSTTGVKYCSIAMHGDATV